MKSSCVLGYIACIPFKVSRGFGGTLPPFFRVEVLATQETSQALLATCLLLVSGLTYSLTLKMETIYSSETSVNFQRTTRNSVPEDIALHLNTVYGVLLITSNGWIATMS
jgi:hypothetical protein